jgi:hypothetical protein
MIFVVSAFFYFEALLARLAEYRFFFFHSALTLIKSSSFLYYKLYKLAIQCKKLLRKLQEKQNECSLNAKSPIIIGVGGGGCELRNSF